MTRTAPKDLSTRKPETKEYYYLVAGTVFFTTGENPEEPVSLPMNGIIRNSHGRLSTSQLGAAQNCLAQACADKLGPQVQMNLIDVQLQNICKLGHMLPSEFHDVQFQAAPAVTMEDVAPAKVV